MCVLCRGVAIWFAGQSQFSRLHSLGDREQTVVQRRRVFRRALSDARMPRLMPHRGVLYILLVGYIGYRSRSACMVIRYNLTPFASAVAVIRRTPSSRAQTSYRPRERRDDMRPPPADGSSTRGGSASVRGRVRCLRLAKLQAASVPIAQGSCAPRAAAPWDRQTDGRIDVRVAVSLNAPSPYGGRHKKPSL